MHQPRIECAALCLVLAFVSGLGTTTSAAAATVRIATDAPYRPMEFRNAAGRLQGFDIDLGNALCARAGVSCRWVVQAWDGIVPGLAARKYDAVLSAMAMTPARRRVLRFVGPYIRMPSAWFVPAGAGPITFTAQGLAGRRIGVQRGTIQDRYVTDRFAATAQIKRYRTADDMAVDMQAGRLDALLVTATVGQQMLDARSSVTYRRVAPDPPLDQALGMAFRPNEPALAQRFAQALDGLRADGTLARLRHRWLDGPALSSAEESAAASGP